MSDNAADDAKASHGVSTTLSHGGRNPERFDGFINPPVYRGSTVLFPTVEKLKTGGQPYKYGRRGTPLTESLEGLIAEVEGGHRTVLTPSGLAAVSGALLAFLRAGDHLLMSDSVYTPARNVATNFLGTLGVEVEFYDPLIGCGIGQLLRPNTRVVYVEAPGSQTFDMQDIPAIKRGLAGRDEIILMADNTWASPLYCDPFALGADISIQAGTKYIVGHADAMLGAIAAGDAELAARLVARVQDLGMCAGTEEMYLGLRGMRTLRLRLEHHWRAGLRVAEWLAGRPEVERVMHPGRVDDPGYPIWKRDFKGASGLFGIVLHPASDAQVARFCETLSLFGMGYSWGGFESLILPFDPRSSRTVTTWDLAGPALRLHIGLEDPEDLIADLERGFDAMAQATV